MTEPIREWEDDPMFDNLYHQLNSYSYLTASHKVKEFVRNLLTAREDQARLEGRAEAVEKMSQFLKEECGYQGKHIEHIKPRHGNCCTCQTCGQDHEGCVCQNNRIHAALSSLKTKEEHAFCDHDWRDISTSQERCQGCLMIRPS